ncbi:flagellar hook-length control protein FliK [Halomonas binhaiensis]|uniref:Flagellar hook-length control protein FliK n=1 Tax=Halomonas binhaiensis TaxID=2562282 RepID=A0A5C1NPR5_9GAMM|nr:flagellar hook-length control protein FliK [Halomonas binhaiensis]QEM83799.1 hypothetical protein E4T21_21165 [Halomonas binhaiensis]
MSGLTPLIDTLLHQVLGKRVDVPATRAPHAPVTPVDPSRFTRPAHSDSRLQGETASTSVGAHATKQTTGNPSRPAASASLARSGEPANASAVPHLSKSAWRIAELLQRFPAMPSRLAPSRPLLDTMPMRLSTSQTPGTNAPPSDEHANIVHELSGRLNGSVRDSGLFYEAHLARWFKGDMDITQLTREPHNHLPSPTTNVLEALMRHQLEMLVTPQLRWEGEAWLGMFMTLLMQPAAWQCPDHDNPSVTKEDDAGRENAWDTQLHLDLNTLGCISAHLCMTKSHLDIALTNFDEARRPYLEHHKAALEARLRGHGLEHVQVTLSSPAEDGGPHHGTP